MGHTNSDEIVKAELLIHDMRLILFHQQFIRFEAVIRKKYFHGMIIEGS